MNEGTSNINLGPLAARVEATRPELRSLLKAGLLVAALRNIPLSWQIGNTIISVVTQPRVNKNGQLEIWIDANGIQLNNPYLFVNPPLLVPDVGTWIDAEGNEYKNFREDAAEAALTIIAQAVGVL